MSSLHVIRGDRVESLEGGEVLAAVDRSNPLGPLWPLPHAGLSARTIVYSGTLGEKLFEAHPRNWMSAGWEALSGLCDRLAPQLVAEHREVWFHPHSRHVLSDAQGCLRFLARREGSPFSVLFAPASLLEASMLGDIEEHLSRSFELLAGRCPGIMLADARLDDQGHRHPAPLGEGLLPRDLVHTLLRDHVDDQTPIIISNTSIEQQRAWLRGQES